MCQTRKAAAVATTMTASACTERGVAMPGRRRDALQAPATSHTAPASEMSCRQVRSRPAALPAAAPSMSSQPGTNVRRQPSPRRPAESRRHRGIGPWPRTAEPWRRSAPRRRIAHEPAVVQESAGGELVRTRQTGQRRQPLTEVDQAGASILSGRRAGVRTGSRHRVRSVAAVEGAPQAQVEKADTLCPRDIRG